MRTLEIGRSGVICSTLGLGCMGMSEFYGETDDEESLRTLARALELGVTHYDTSNVYGRGANERLVGKFLRGQRDKVTVASKFGVVRDPDGPLGSVYDRELDNSPKYMRQCCEESLARLGTDTIDLYYVHRADPTIAIEETVGALARLRDEGKIRAIGLSEVDAATLRRAANETQIDALQSEYSLWTRDVEAEVLPTCRELGITFVAYSPLGRGFLTGQITKADDLADDDFRLTSPRFQGENFDRNFALVDHVRELAAARNCTAGQIAIAWLLHQGDDILPIPGTKRIRYLEENVGAIGVTLTKDDLDQIDAILPPGGAAGDRYDKSFKGNPEATR
ncbi:aldo/keto reductase [Croceicoccus ponticola]|uniref:Aldo/keto reductase n=1 Tax=Croceicoccus ponticola TaxID=2217664 RepID=A0A437GW26_9SPHN|nr:aldo/keto reductase [Croceicoccus ponticola]RVQ66330.1 aldo/keto reductase [Croceicoccus ponticola]